MIVAALSGSEHNAKAQSLPDVVADGFEAPSLDLEIWNPSRISTDRYRIDGSFTRSGNGALAVSVEASDRGCDGNCQRNEIRIASPLRLPFGEAAWYGFSFQVRGDNLADDAYRWIIGQWKEESGGSPFLAQRYSAGVFHITAQDSDCRILVARAGSTAKEFLDTLAARAYGEFPFITGGTGDYECEPDIKIEYGEHPILPNPYEDWVDMAYFVKGGRNGDGIIEVWANGRFIVRLEGSIGNDEFFGPTQYFKIGMYRAVAPGSATVYFDNFRRGTSRAEVDPTLAVLP